jgi:PST family polysaccharide transporter
MNLSNLQNIKSFEKRALIGINWNFLNNAVQIFLTLTVNIVLARLIDPEEFGLLAIAYIFTGLVGPFTAIGMGAALIQKMDISDYHIRVSITLSSFVGFIITLTIWIMAEPVASFFNQNKIALILKILSLNFLTTGITATSYGLLRRRFQFKTIFFIRSISYTIGFAFFSIPMAYYGNGVWSIVVGVLSQGVISCLLFYIYAKPPLKPYLKSKEVLDLLKFGTGITISSWINYAANSVDHFVIGKFLSSIDLGFYSRASFLIRIPRDKISQVIADVLFPAYSEIQNFKKKILLNYSKTINAITIILFPILVGMSIGAKYIILGLYGPNWLGAITIFRILCISAIFKATIPISGAVVRATGKIYAENKIQLVYLALLTIGSLIGLNYGINGIGIAVLISSLWLHLAMTVLIIKIIKGDLKYYFYSYMPGIFIAIIIGSLELILIFLMDNIFPYERIILKLIILICLLSMTYILCFVYLPKNIKGEIPRWIIYQYGKYLPKLIRTWMSKNI